MHASCHRVIIRLAPFTPIRHVNKNARVNQSGKRVKDLTPPVSSTPAFTLLQKSNKMLLCPLLRRRRSNKKTSEHASATYAQTQEGGMTVHSPPADHMSTMLSDASSHWTSPSTSTQYTKVWEIVTLEEMGRVGRRRIFRCCAPICHAKLCQNNFKTALALVFQLLYP